MQDITSANEHGPGPLPSRYLALRITAERLLVVAALPVLLPLCGVIALAIRLDSPGPVLFRQRRPGLGQTAFIILKFRTMYVEVCGDGRDLTVHGDSRVTRVGQLLRALHLDEIPQMWNVMCGEMSLIGPRPEPLPYAEMIEATLPHYGERRLILPGLTGWAQVCLGYTDDLDGARKKLEYDLYYIHNVSLRFDLSILARTILVVLTSRGAR